MNLDLEEVLKELTVRSTGLAAAIVGRDGVVTGSYTGPDFPGDMEEVAAGHVSLVKGFEERGGLKSLGTLKEFILLTDSFKLLLMPIDQDHFLILAAARGTYMGKARFVLRRAVERLRGVF